MGLQAFLRELIVFFFSSIIIAQETFFYMKKNILITGGAGFVGSSLAIAFKEKYPSYQIIALDNLKRRGSELNIPRLTQRGVQFIHGDIRNKEDFEGIGVPIDVLLEASAEPSVLAGLNSGLDYLIHTNLQGTINCLNFAHQQKADFIFLSTSRIYPIQPIEDSAFEENETRFVLKDEQAYPGISSQGIAEHFPLEGHRSFYGATKLASELMIQEYHHFYQMKTVINRFGVISGPWQMGKVDQGFVVLWLARHFWKKALSYNGYGGLGKQVRDVLHIRDVFDLIDYQIHHIEEFTGQTFNIGGGLENSISLLELTQKCREITGNMIDIAPVLSQSGTDIRIYISNNAKILQKTNWKVSRNIDELLADIYAWMIENERLLIGILN